MGIVNVTPDSFSGDGLVGAELTPAEHAAKLVDEGARIIDVGGQSTRPGYQTVEETEELDRVLPAVRQIVRQLDVAVSIDTTRPEVARQAIAAGASIVNDVSGLHDANMLDVVVEAGAGLVVVHHGLFTSGSVREAFIKLQRIADRAEKAGVEHDRITVDPGLGIGGKTWVHNFEIIRALPMLRELGRPILIGPSRKGMIGRVLGTGVNDRLEGSLALAALCYARGAQCVRAHDVRQTFDVARMIDAIEGDVPPDNFRL